MKTLEMSRKVIIAVGIAIILILAYTIPLFLISPLTVEVNRGWNNNKAYIALKIAEGGNLTETLNEYNITIFDNSTLQRYINTSRNVPLYDLLKGVLKRRIKIIYNAIAWEGIVSLNITFDGDWVKINVSAENLIDEIMGPFFKIYFNDSGKFKVVNSSLHMKVRGIVLVMKLVYERLEDRLLVSYISAINHLQVIILDYNFNALLVAYEEYAVYS